MHIHTMLGKWYNSHLHFKKKMILLTYIASSTKLKGVNMISLQILIQKSLTYKQIGWHFGLL